MLSLRKFQNANNRIEMKDVMWLIILIFCINVIGYNSLSQVRKYPLCMKIVHSSYILFFPNLASYHGASRTGKDCGKDDDGTCRNVKYSVDKMVRDGHYWDSSWKNDYAYVQERRLSFFFHIT